MWERLWKWATGFRPCSHEGCPMRASGIAFGVRSRRLTVPDELRRARSGGYIPLGTSFAVLTEPVYYCPDHLEVYRENHSRD